MRRDNLVTLEWHQVDLERRLIILEHTKNGDRLGIQICDHAMTVSQELRHARSKTFGPVFTQEDGAPIKGDSVGMAFGRVRRQVGVTNFRFHDLRQAFTSTLVQRRVDLYRVQRLLEHRDGRMTQRYAHLAQENLQEAIQVFNGEYHKSSTMAVEGSQGIALGV